jgi:hypothetical protein
LCLLSISNSYSCCQHDIRYSGLKAMHENPQMHLHNEPDVWSDSGCIVRCLSLGKTPPLGLLELLLCWQP